MTKVVIQVQEDKNRLPKNFIYNGTLYIVKDAIMHSFQPTPCGNKGIKVLCRVDGQKHDVVLWMNGDEWFVEF